MNKFTQITETFFKIFRSYLDAQINILKIKCASYSYAQEEIYSEDAIEHAERATGITLEVGTHDHDILREIQLDAVNMFRQTNSDEMIKMELVLELESLIYCTGCKLLSFNKPRTSSQIRKAFCAIDRKIIAGYVEDKKTVLRPKWCPLK